MNYFELHIGDLESATAHLSMVEDGAYSRLMRVYYRLEGPLPADMKQVFRLIRAQNKSERDAVTAVLSEFFSLRIDGWHQDRCDEEVARYQDKQKKARASADARWARSPNHANDDADADANASDEAMRTHSERNAPPTRARPRAPARPQSPVTNHQTPDKGPRSPTPPPNEAAASPAAPGERRPADIPSDPPPNADQSRLAAIVGPMKAAGIMPAPGHTDFMALLEAGATWAEFEPHVERALKADRPFPYLVAAVIGARQRAAARGPLPPAPPARAPAESPITRGRRELYSALSGGLTDPFQPPAPAPTGDVIDMELNDVNPRRIA